MEIIGYTQDTLSSGLEQMESSINFGDKARVTLCTEALPDEEQLAEMYQGMIATGHHVSYPIGKMINGIPTTEFVIQKGSPFWPLIVPLIIPILTIGLIVWGITKIGDISRAIIPLILVTGGVIIVLAAVLSRPATKYIERGGKIPYLPNTQTPKDLAEKARGLWEKMCDWEKVPKDSKFVEFSENNPYQKEYNEVIGQLLRFKQFQLGLWKPAVIKSKKALAAR